MCQPHTSQNFSPPLGTGTDLTLQAAESSQVPQPIVQNPPQCDEKRSDVWGTPFSIKVIFLTMVTLTKRCWMRPVMTK